MHVISASRRTDIPAFYADWLRGRLEAGWCEVRQPFNHRLSRVSLAPADVAAIVFWTKNPNPLLPHLDWLRERGYPCYFQFTITPYDHVFEHAVLPPARAVAAAHELAARLGPRLVVWRYDPIVETSLTPWDWHLERFASLAKALAGATQRCVFSFVNLYRRTRLRLDALAVEHGFDYRFYATQPAEAPRSRHGLAYELEEMRSRSRQLAALAAGHGLRLESCCGAALIDAAHGVGAARCIDPDLVAFARGEPVHLPSKPSRPDCGCVASIDIGAYETCPHGCGASYCYAVASHARAVENRRRQDPGAAALGGAGAQP
jgi:hypothetical protein